MQRKKERDYKFILKIIINFATIFLSYLKNNPLEECKTKNSNNLKFFILLFISYFKIIRKRRVKREKIRKNSTNKNNPPVPVRIILIRAPTRTCSKWEEEQRRRNKSTIHLLVNS